jgi:hypothetical protein
MEPAPKVAVSLYPGHFGHTPDRIIRAATLEPRLEQLGDAVPTMRLAFRRDDGDAQLLDHDYLRLTLEDAQELVTALTFLISTATQQLAQRDHVREPSWR